MRFRFVLRRIDPGRCRFEILLDLGVGFPSDFPTWGKLLADAVQRMEEYPERVLLPGIAISLTVLAVNFLGDGLCDALDPRIRGR